MKKWYIAMNHAEEDAAFVVALDELEAAIIREFLEGQDHLVAGGGYCGYMTLFDKVFDSREEAVNYALTMV